MHLLPKEQVKSNDILTDFYCRQLKTEFEREM